MNIDKIFEALLYLALSTLCLVFVLQTIQEYNNGTTSFEVSQEPITLNDLPTFIICWNTFHYGWNSSARKYYLIGFDNKYTYGLNLSIDLNVQETDSRTITLRENEYISTLFGLEFHLSEMRLKRQPDLPCFTSGSMFQTKGWPYKQCYTITPKWSGKASVVDFEKLRFQLAFKVSANSSGTLDTMTNSHYPKVMFASEKNMFGVVAGKVFDGTVNGCFDSSSLMKGSTLKIGEVTETINLPSKCSEESYYECLAKRFAQFDFSQGLKKTYNGTTCTFVKLCAPYSLPFLGDEIPLCDTDLDTGCYGAVLEELKLDQKNHCRPLCHVEKNSKWAEVDR